MYKTRTSLIFVAWYYIRFDYIRWLSCPNAKHRKCGLLSPRGKRTAIVRRFPAFFLFFFFFPRQCLRVSIPPAVRPALFTTDGYGIFNVRTNWVRTRKGVRRRQVCTRIDSETEELWLPVPRQGVEARPIPAGNPRSGVLRIEIKGPSCIWNHRSYLVLF